MKERVSVLTAFIWFAGWGIGSTALFGVGWIITAIFQNQAAAAELTNAWLFVFNGILTGAAGYGAVFFLCRERSGLIEALLNVIEVPLPLKYEFTRRLELVRSWRLTHLVAILLTIIGGYIAHGAGIPLKVDNEVAGGFAHVYLSGAVFSFYFVGAYGLMVIVAILYFFRFIEEHCDPASVDRITLKVPFQALDVERIDQFFIISSAMCISAVYVCFRTTLTAFAAAPPTFYRAMIIPVFFFLPAALVYSFYPRYLLRQVWETDTFVTIEQFATDMAEEPSSDLKSRLEMRKLILDVKEKLLAERRALPLLSLKDAPTLTMAILMSLQLVTEKDPIIKMFFSGK